LHSFWGLSKNRDVVDENHEITVVAVVGVLPAVTLVLANLQTMTEPLILPSRREHPQKEKNPYGLWLNASFGMRLREAGGTTLAAARPILKSLSSD